MCFVALNNNIVYIVTSGSKEQSNKVMSDWRALNYNTTAHNLILYVKLFRQAVGLPSGISLEEEFELLHGHYGAKLYTSGKFLEAMSEVKREYDKAKKILPDFSTWAAECGCTVEETDRVLYI